MYVTTTPISIKPGFYAAFGTLTVEQAKAELKAAWDAIITPRPSHLQTCPRCGGRGYTKADLNVGCEGCHGSGSI